MRLAILALAALAQNPGQYTQFPTPGDKSGLGHYRSLTVAAQFRPAPLQSRDRKGADAAAPPRPLSIREAGRQVIDVRPGRYLIGADGASRTVFFYEPRRATVFRVAADTGRTTEMTLEDAPEYSKNSVSVLEGAAVNERGESVIPAVWRTGGRRFSSGFFVYSREGRYVKTIALNPPVELRRAARGPDGSYYVMGVDPASRTGRRLLVHKYTGAGKRTTAFSECPEAEAQYGRLWVNSGLVYHVQPGARRIRVFDTSGRMLREAAIEHPAGAPDSIQAVLPLPGNQLLVEWAGTGTYLAQRYLSLHNENGLAISAATPEPERSAAIFTDSRGNCYFLRYTPAGKQEIFRAVLTR